MKLLLCKWFVRRNSAVTCSNEARETTACTRLLTHPATTLHCCAQDAIAISATFDWARSELSMAARYNPEREAFDHKSSLRMLLLHAGFYEIIITCYVAANRNSVSITI
jgi:hypothetical protein